MSEFGSVRQRLQGTTALRAAAILALAALVGCSAYGQAVVDPYPEDIRQRHPISLREGPKTLEVFVGINRGELSPAQRADLVAFAHTWRRESTGGILIEIPSGTPNARAAADAVAEVRSILAATGASPAVIATRRYRPVTPVKFATLRLSYPKMVAEAGPCGLWPRDLGPNIEGIDPSNHAYWNFGCTQQRNLAAMVDTPADLVQPRGETPAYTARRTFMLDKYRKGDPTPTKNPEVEKGKISEIAK